MVALCQPGGLAAIGIQWVSIGRANGAQLVIIEAANLGANDKGTMRPLILWTSLTGNGKHGSGAFFGTWDAIDLMDEPDHQW